MVEAKFVMPIHEWKRRKSSPTRCHEFNWRKMVRESR